MIALVMLAAALGAIVGASIATWHGLAIMRRVLEDRDAWRSEAERRGLAHERLSTAVVGLKRKGFEPSNAGRITAPPDPEAKALRQVEERFTEQLQQRRAEAEAEFEDSAVNDLMQQGLTRDQAIAEAKRLRSSVTDMHPAGG